MRRLRTACLVLGILFLIAFISSCFLYASPRFTIWWPFMVIFGIPAFLLICGGCLTGDFNSGTIENHQVITSEPVSLPVYRTNTSLDNNIPNSVSEEEDKPPSYTSIDLTYPNRTHQNQ
jgi:hypothetical protein